MREKYESLSLTVLKELAKARGMKGISAMKKSDLVEAMLAQDEKDKAHEAQQRPGEPARRERQEHSGQKRESAEGEIPRRESQENG
ncbi:MAG TPA: Rho termination factor N-terminal domain-containing protein, partial [Candidatus Choladousia intestinipullorum]|nr:Rho termination factor N-terminal domain-containing protein [Candidatus Choladousia intestinipullorum]